MTGNLRLHYPGENGDPGGLTVVAGFPLSRNDGVVISPAVHPKTLSIGLCSRRQLLWL